MKRFSFITLFICAQIGMMVLQIHKHSNRMQLLYTRQKNETFLNQLLLKRQELTQCLCALNDRVAIKKFAEEELHMTPIQLSQIKKLPVCDAQ